MEPLISVIVPIYKVEPYLNRCVSSIVEQTYRNLEIILVDDGSPDSCPRICEEWKKRDSRVQVIHQINGGLSAARNTGLKAATGDYIVFEDSDDWMEQNTIELLYSVSVSKDADIVQSRGIAFYEGEETFRLAKMGRILEYTPVEAVRGLLESVEPFRIVAFGKIFRKKVLEGIQFPVGRIYEDSYIIPDIVLNANKYVILDAPIYYYRFSPNSILRSSFSEKRLDALYAQEHRIAWCKENNLPALQLLVQKQYIAKLYELAIQAKESTLPNRNSIVRELKQKLTAYGREALRKPQLLPMYLRKSLQMKLLK